MIRFGTFVPQGWLREFRDTKESGKEWDSIKKFAIEADRLGFYSICLYDHFITFPELTTEPCFECWTTLSSLAPLTTKVKLFQLVTCQSHRSPALLAKMAATLDTISGGRLELGIGAGWGKKEHEAYGIPFEEKPSVRIKQMKEAVQILIKMWTEDKPTFRGKYYTIVEAINNPKPIQKPHPPIYVGGRGKQLTLKVAAQLADGTNLGGRCSVKDAEEALIALKKHCAEVGRDFDGITKSYESEFTIIDEDKTNVQNKIKKYMPRITLGKPTRVEDFISWNLIGTPHEIIDRIQEYVDVGIDYFILRFPDGLEIEPLQLFADEVMSSF